MRDTKQIQKEIEDVKLQINIAEAAATTSVGDAQENWNQKIQSLQAKREKLEQELINVPDYEIDDATADAMLESILAVADNAETDNSKEQTTDVMADAMIETILSAPHANHTDVATDTMADAMLDSILSVEDISSTVSFDDATADAMLNSILSAQEPADENSVIIDDTTADAMLNSILADVSEEQPSEADDSETATIVEPITVAPENVADGIESNQPDSVAFAQSNTDDVNNNFMQDDGIADEMLNKILSAQIDYEPIVQPERQDSVTLSQESAPHEQVSVNDGYITPEVDSHSDIKASNATEADMLLQIQKLKLEAEDAKRRADAALMEAEKIKKEAEQIKLAAETERAMFAAEMELQRGLRNEEENMRIASEQAEKDKIAEKIARRKAEITAIRNGLQDVKDTDSAFLLREKLFSIQLVLDDDERNSPEISYLLTKSMDDISHSLEVAELKRRIAALTAVRKAPVKKKPAAAKKKKATAKKAAAKKKRAVVASRHVPARPGHPPARRRYMMRPSPYSPRYYR